MMKALIIVSIFLAGLGFSACKTTPEPSTPMPPQPQTQETDKGSSAPSSENRQPDQTSTPPASNTGQPTRPDATETAKQAPTAQSQRQPVESNYEGESTPSEAAQKSEKRRPEAPSAESPPKMGESESEVPSTQASRKSERPRPQAPFTAESKLEKAREDLKVSEATERKIAAKLEQLKKSGTASADDIRDYEIYHERVQDMVAENRKRVEKMERAYREHTTEGKIPPKPAGTESSGTDEAIPEAQTQDQVAELDRQLTASLNQFDAMLLKEMETIETQSAAKMRDLAQEAAEAAKRLKEKGIDLGNPESESSDETSEEKTGDKSTSAEKDDTEAEQGDDDSKVASGNRPKGEGPGPKNDRGSRYSKEDDDIVARQLREAAENETDPELKEKLWKEYEDYKKNTQ